MTRMFTRDDIENAFGAVPRRLDDITSGLNPRQLEAVESLDGPVCILAGAGTGKTTVLIRRIANLIAKGRARPEEILAVTFTRKAAAEMRHRLGAMMGDDVARRVEIGNFHSVCAQMLRRHAHLVGLPQRFNVLDDDGQKEVIATVALQLGLLASRKDKNTIMNYLVQIASWKEEGYDVAQVASAPDLAALPGASKADEPDFLIRAAKVFEAYQAQLTLHRWCDFADLVLHMVRIFRAHPEIRDLEAGRFRHILVDEFQDSSPVQNEWVTWMGMSHRNVCVVGDTDQSIYEWRNARPEIMMNFPKTWEGCTRVTIDTNYRSSQEILDVANIVVQPLRAKDKLDKMLRSPRRGPHPSDFVRSYPSGYEEADEIASQIDERLRKGTQASEIAILCRSGMIITGIERSLRERGIRYVVAGAMKFTEREEVKDAIAWLTLASNPDDYVAFTRIAAKPSRGLGPQKVGDIRRVMMDNKLTCGEASARLAADAKPGSTNARHFGEFRDLMRSITTVVENGSSAGDMLEDILDESGYWDWRAGNEADPQHEQRIENLMQIIDEARSYKTPVEFLEMVALQSASDKGWGDDCVVVSTVHASKGLEFDIVFTPAMEEGVFPNGRSEKTAYGADEERRLAHVAWTRARHELHISHAAYRMGSQSQGIPSRYLHEAGLLGGQASSHRPTARPSSAPGRLRGMRF